METVKALAIIVGALFGGEFIGQLITLPIPGTIYGMVVLFLLLYSGLVKIDDIEVATNFLLANMTIFFIPPAVGIMESYRLIVADLFKYIIVIIVPSILTMAVTALVVRKIIGDEDVK